MSLLKQKTVGSIIAPLTKVLDELKDHMDAKLEEIGYHGQQVRLAQSEKDEAEKLIARLTNLLG